MRREQPGTHAAHREEEHQNPPAHAVEEPRKRSYERVIDGEEAFPDDLTDGLTAEGLPIETAEAELTELTAPEEGEAPELAGKAPEDAGAGKE